MSTRRSSPDPTAELGVQSPAPLAGAPSTPHGASILIRIFLYLILLPAVLALLAKLVLS